MTYDVEISRDESGPWLASVPSVPGCHSYGRSLRQARQRIREALSLWVEDADEAVLSFHYRLSAEARSELTKVRSARRKAAIAQADASAATRHAAENLRRAGLSLRDSADLLELSHQRVQQLLDEEPDRVEWPLAVSRRVRPRRTR